MTKYYCSYHNKRINTKKYRGKCGKKQGNYKYCKYLFVFETSDLEKKLKN